MNIQITMLVLTILVALITFTMPFGAFSLSLMICLSEIMIFIMMTSIILIKN